MMDPTEEDRARALQDLSALADGHADATAVGAACTRWRADAELRASWHAYHVIGDVLRSEELACDARRDASLVRAIRERLAAEPVVLAPIAAEPSGVRRRSRWSWLAPAAVAAGFVAVAGVLVVTQGTPPMAGQGDAVVQSLAARAPARSVAVDAVQVVAPTFMTADSQLMRDSGLRSYLAAHKEFGGSSALGASSGFLRAATSQVPDR